MMLGLSPKKRTINNSSKLTPTLGADRKETSYLQYLAAPARAFNT